MEERRLGRTGLMVSAIGFGGIKLPEVSPDDASELLNRALDLGINFFDTARGYGDSEEKIGRSISSRRDEFYISTKSTAVDADDMRRDIETSLRNLRTDHIDLYLCHNLRQPEIYDRVMGPGGALEALKKARDEGLIRHIGFSSHRFLETMERGILSGEFEAIMVSYNMLNDELTEERIIPLAHEKDLGVIAMKPLAGGALGSPPRELKAGSGGFNIKVNAREALRFVLSNRAVSTAIPGMRNLRELEENVEVGRTFSAMSDYERSELGKAAESLGKDFCRGCGYCMPCPQGIRIPVILRQLGYYKYYGLVDWARGRYRMVEVKADKCIRCEECVDKCPYNLPVPDMMEEAARVLQI